MKTLYHGFSWSTLVYTTPDYGITYTYQAGRFNMLIGLSFAVVV